MRHPLRPKSLSKDGSRRVTDEFYNTLIAALGAALSLIGIVVIITMAAIEHKPWHVFSFSIYGITLMSVFVTSALHHGVDGSEKTNQLLHQLDYYAISLMIAGTFTPFCLIALRNTLCCSVLGLVWFLAILGMVLKLKFPDLPKRISTSLFILMGWLGLVIAYPLYQKTPWGLGMMMIGGVFFTIGAVIFTLEKPNPVPGRFGFHEIWHLFVLAGAGSHFFAVSFYLLPIP